MYAHCLFCTHDLGRNQALENFPVGRRLAYDAEKGRLWVVCTRCERWNLTPLEERWEAIDEAERLFRASRLRVCTDNIGLARVADDTDLVRIGSPQRPEMAAWRYGDQFRRRRRRFISGGVGGVAVAGAVLMLQPSAESFRAASLVSGMISGWAIILLPVLGNASIFARRTIRDGQGKYLVLTPNELSSARLVQGGADGWGVKVPYQSRRESAAPRARDWIKTGAIGEMLLTGEPAEQAMRQLLPLVNGQGASSGTVQRAVTTLDELGGPSSAFRGAAGHLHEYATKQNFGDTGALHALPVAVRLALEMAAHEEQERRALDGELAMLQQSWRDAEEIAAIADDLELPHGVRGALARLTARVRGG